MKTLKLMRKKEKDKFVVPKAVQDVIPIKAVFKDGIFVVGNNLYSKTFRFSDINYNIAGNEEKQELMKGYWAVLSAPALPLNSRSITTSLTERSLRDLS